MAATVVKTVRKWDLVPMGVEQCGLKVKDLGVVIGRGAGTASRLYAVAPEVRRATPAFAVMVGKVTAVLRKRSKRASRQ